MDGRTQYGLVVCANVEDYLTGKIKKHELTRKDKEEDRMIHVRIQNANVEPVFFTYPDNAEINALVSRYAAGEPEYDFVALTKDNVFRVENGDRLGYLTSGCTWIWRTRN